MPYDMDSDDLQVNPAARDFLRKLAMGANGEEEDPTRKFVRRMSGQSGNGTPGVPPPDNVPQPFNRTGGRLQSGLPHPAGQPVNPTDPSATTTPTATASPQARTMGNVMASPPTRLSVHPPAPVQPPVNPEMAATQEKLRAAATPTDRQDPQYKAGAGTRIGRALMGLASGGIPGAVQGARNPLNNQYYRDENSRREQLQGLQTQAGSLENEENINQSRYGKDLTAYADSVREASAQDLRSQQAVNEADKVQQNQNLNDLKQQAQDLKEQIRDNPQTVEKGVMQEIQKGDTVYDAKGNLVKAGPATRTWLKERRNQPIVNIRNGGKGDNPELNGMSAAEQREFVDRTKTIDRKLNTILSAQTSRLTMKMDVSDLDAQADTLQKQKDAIRDEIISGRGKGSKAQSAAERIRARKAGTPPPVSKPAPVAPKGAPTTPTPAGQKSITKAEIQALADQHKVPYADAEKQFTGKGYTVR